MGRETEKYQRSEEVEGTKKLEEDVGTLNSVATRDGRQGDFMIDDLGTAIS